MNVCTNSFKLFIISHSSEISDHLFIFHNTIWFSGLRKEKDELILKLSYQVRTHFFIEENKLLVNIRFFQLLRLFMRTYIVPTHITDSFLFLGMQHYWNTTLN